MNAERLKEKRLEKGWSKNYAAEEMNLSQSVYFRYESGESLPSYSAIKNMALTLGTSVEYLTGKTNDDRPVEYIVDCSDSRLSFIIEQYKSYPEDTKERLYKYVKKLSSNK
jgi:transcriptional regulator with XRE-family HTH domain